MAVPSFTEVLGAIYQAGMEPELWPEALGKVAEHLGADSGMVLNLSAQGDFIIHHGLRDDLNREFLQHHTRNPFAAGLSRAPLGEALVTEAVISKELLYRSAFYTDILAPQRITDILAVKRSDLSRNGVGGVLFNFTRSRADEIAHAAARLQDLVSHLNRAIDCTLLTSRLKAGQRRFDEILARCGGAIVLLDRVGGILQLSPMAAALLAEHDGLVTTSGGQAILSAQGREDASRLAKSIGQALAVARGVPQRLDSGLKINRPSGRAALLVQVTPLPVEALTPWGASDDGARVLVQIVDPAASHETNARLLAAFDLTAAESRVAGLIASGLTAPQAAKVLGLSPNTVRTHLARCFDKTGVHSQVALARLLASIATPPPG
jgi:DNA-binding CsgD family transcriptional regulator